VYKIVFFVPDSHVEAVKRAVFLAGAGRFRGYDSACWQTTGTGQFRPLAGSSPFLGEANRLESVPETRVETVCADECVRSALRALVDAHPYEEPAYEAYRVYSLDDLPI